jgi:hypothetical protein
MRTFSCKETHQNDRCLSIVMDDHSPTSDVLSTTGVKETLQVRHVHQMIENQTAFGRLRT